MKKKKSQQKDLKVFKGNSLVEAKYKLTLTEQKFILFTISKINKEDQGETYGFHVKDFAAALDINRPDAYKVLRRLIKSIMRHPLTFCPDPDTEIISNWFSFITYKRRKAIIYFEFAPGLIPYLFNLKEKFTAYSLKNILQLHSTYSIRLYELIKQYEWLGEREINLDELKEMLGIPGCYLVYAEFKRNVLEVARKELLANADISFTYKEIKDGKKVTGISFELVY